MDKMFKIMSLIHNAAHLRKYLSFYKILDVHIALLNVIFDDFLLFMSGGTIRDWHKKVKTIIFYFLL
jgi:hypothetical protein